MVINIPRIHRLISQYYIHSFRLKDTLKSALEQYGTEFPQLDMFPASIKLDQAVEAWKHIVHHYANLGAANSQ